MEPEIIQAHKLELREIKQKILNIQSGLEYKIKQSKLLNFKLLDFDTLQQLKMQSIPFDVKRVDIRESTEEILDLLIKEAELRQIKLTADYRGFPNQTPSFENLD